MWSVSFSTWTVTCGKSMENPAAVFHAHPFEAVTRRHSAARAQDFIALAKHGACLLVAVDRRATGSLAFAIPIGVANITAPRARRSRATLKTRHLTCSTGKDGANSSL